MFLIINYRIFSEFSINWDKSVIMPLDPIREPLPLAATQIKLVTSFKYLGVEASLNVTEYPNLNSFPLLRKMGKVSVVWYKLPSSVVGRVNLVKRAWMPHLILCYIIVQFGLPQHIFKQIVTLFWELIRKHGKARICLSICHLPKDELAIPNVKLYFFKSQMQQIAGWVEIDPHDPIQRILFSSLSKDQLCFLAADSSFLDAPLLLNFFVDT